MIYRIEVQFGLGMNTPIGINKNLCGVSRMSPSIARKTLELLISAKIDSKNAATNSNVAEDHNLTEREKEILNLLVEGLEYKEIAKITTTSPNTIRNHITNIYRKLHVTSKAQAIRLAMNKKWF